jgi:arsenate reductase
MTITVYGITNCDQVRKTLAWLRENGIGHRFHDFRADGLERGMLERWCTHLPWNSLLNRRGATWRSIDEPARAAVVDQTSAIEIMLAHPTLVKRPVVEIEDRLLLGFSAERLAAALLPAEAHGSGS